VSRDDPGRGAFLSRRALLASAVFLGQGSPGVSAVIARGDPTAHAEMEAIREAARRLGTRDLDGAELYGSSRACPMCEAAAYWARVSRMYAGESAQDEGPPRSRAC
jgi:tRNA(Arg) A34 adenosine deaminase TadA